MPQARDERLRNLEWRDLLPLSRAEVVYETLITTPWLAGSLVAWHLATTSHPSFAALALASAFFAVWTVHHDCQPLGRIARTQRGWLKNIVSYDMFHHVEHHLFPAVPTCHLPELSQRLDRVAPEYKDLTVY